MQHILFNGIFRPSYYFPSTKYILGICVQHLGVFVPLFNLLLTKQLVLGVHAVQIKALKRNKRSTMGTRPEQMSYTLALPIFSFV